MTRTRWLFSFVTRIVFVGNLVLGTVAFLLFLNWYDTGKLGSSGWHVAATGGIFWGGLVLLVEVWLYNRYKFLANNHLAFFMQIIALSTLCIALGFSSSSVYFAICEVISGASFFTILSALVLVSTLGMFYLLMAVPFGVLVGIVNGFLLQFSHAFDDHR